MRRDKDWLKVVADVHRFDFAGFGFFIIRERPDMNDFLTFFPGDLRPIIRVCRVRQIFLLFEFFSDGLQKIFAGESLLSLRKSCV